MPDEKVLGFPFRDALSSKNFVASQLELFERIDFSATKIAFIQPDEIDQSVFFSIIARNRINVVFDYRPRPIFRKPSYSHKEVTKYFFDRDMLYVEIARYAQRYGEDVQKFGSAISQELRRKRAERSIYCLGLFDEVALEAGIVDQFRFSLSGLGNAVVEVHPRALLR